MTPSDLSALTFSLLAAAPAPVRSPSGQPDHTDTATLPLFADVLAQTQDSAAAADTAGVAATTVANTQPPKPPAATTAHAAGATTAAQPSQAPGNPGPALFPAKSVEIAEAALPAATLPSPTASPHTKATTTSSEQEATTVAQPGEAASNPHTGIGVEAARVPTRPLEQAATITTPWAPSTVSALPAATAAGPAVPPVSVPAPATVAAAQPVQIQAQQPAVQLELPAIGIAAQPQTAPEATAEITTTSTLVASPAPAAPETTSTPTHPEQMAAPDSTALDATSAHSVQAATTTAAAATQVATPATTTHTPRPSSTLDVAQRSQTQRLIPSSRNTSLANAVSLPAEATPSDRTIPGIAITGTPPARPRTRQAAAPDEPVVTPTAIGMPAATITPSTATDQTTATTARAPGSAPALASALASATPETATTLPVTSTAAEPLYGADNTATAVMPTAPASAAPSRNDPSPAQTDGEAAVATATTPPAQQAARLPSTPSANREQAMAPAKPTNITPAAASPASANSAAPASNATPAIATRTASAGDATPANPAASPAATDQTSVTTARTPPPALAPASATPATAAALPATSTAAKPTYGADNAATAVMPTAPTSATPSRNNPGPAQTDGESAVATAITTPPAQQAARPASTPSANRQSATVPAIPDSIAPAAGRPTSVNTAAPASDATPVAAARLASAGDTAPVNPVASASDQTTAATASTPVPAPALAPASATPATAAALPATLTAAGPAALRSLEAAPLTPPRRETTGGSTRAAISSDTSQAPAVRDGVIFNRAAPQEAASAKSNTGNSVNTDTSTAIDAAPVTTASVTTATLPGTTPASPAEMTTASFTPPSSAAPPAEASYLNTNANTGTDVAAHGSLRPQPAVLNAWTPVDAAVAQRDTSTVALAQQRRQPSATVASTAAALNLPPVAIAASVLSNLPPAQLGGVGASTATTVPQAWQERSQQPVRSTPTALTLPGENPAVAVPAATSQTWAQQDNGNPSDQQQRDPRERTPDGLISPDALQRSTVPEPLPAALLPDAAASAAVAPTAATPVTADAPAPSPINDGQARSLGQALNDAFEALDTQVAYWSANNIQRASLNLQDGQAQALRIEVTLRDGQAQLDFHTDDSTTREALRQNAETALRPLLESHGLELAGWSIGAQTAGQGNTPERQPGQQPAAQPDGTRQRTGSSGQGDGAPAPRPAPRTPVRPGGIDIYA